LLTRRYLPCYAPIIQFSIWGRKVKPLFAVSAVALLLLSGCQRKAEGQTVAVVNGDEITIPELNFALQQAKVPDNADKELVRSQLLEKLIDRRLVAGQARKEDIDKSPEFLNRERQETEELLISMLASRRMKAQPLPTDRDVTAFIDSNPQMFSNRETWTVDQVLYTPPKNAQFSTEIQNTKSIDDIIAVLQKYKLKFARRTTKLDTALIPVSIYKQISAVPVDQSFVIPAGDKAVANEVLGKEANPLIGDQAKPIALAAIRRTATEKSIGDLVKSLRSSAKIEYQPGFAPKKT
jgi:EpsD family peptidyl-prolyl cis-trans isomerase